MEGKPPHPRRDVQHVFPLEFLAVGGHGIHDRRAGFINLDLGQLWG